MHDTALFYGKKFFINYAINKSKILDIGSKDENGSLKKVLIVNMNILVLI